ncbi:MAG: sulfate adenylyltransferase subunit CysN [Gammaproteobacteria bacterium]|jgi:bifunctional enzyme CysN/CysC|nr:sulfate adenylyltransferase subunit CysN [Gammaproteobacteria bacterium]
MAHQSDLIEKDIDAYLHAQEHKSFLRFITCGSVDDGKSTLIGRLLYDSKMIYEDQLQALEHASKKMGTQGDEMDLALLVDGLAAEREQGITIDVAYRFFSTDKRKFIVADSPGHEQYTRNMATAASTADLAIILIDARLGVLTQTRRHSYIASLLGVKHIVVAINKMDLVDFSEDVYTEIEKEYRELAESLGFSEVICIPISALNGDNITTVSERIQWYKGPALLPHLEQVDVANEQVTLPFRLPVQWVNRPNLNFRGFSGTVAGGEINVSDEVIVIPSGKRSRVKSIVTHDGELESARADQAVTLTLEDELDISRGDVICGADTPAEQSNQYAAHILWMAEEELLPGRQYLLKTTNKITPATVTELKYKINVNNFDHEPGKSLELNEVGYCNLNLSQSIAFDSYKENRNTGSFILIDRLSNNTVGVGMLEFSLRRAKNVVWQEMAVDKLARAQSKHQKPCVLWFTGLSGSGKSTISNLVDKRLMDIGRHTYVLDGDNVRHGINKDLGFTDVDRVENIRRVGETAKLMVDAGLIVLVSFISPFISERRLARTLVEENEFVEIFVNTPLEVCEKRDRKGLYKKARRGEIKNFTGIDSRYEQPEHAEIEIRTEDCSAEEAAMEIVDYLDNKGYLKS